MSSSLYAIGTVNESPEAIDFLSDLEIYLNSIMRTGAEIQLPVECEIGDIIGEMLDIPLDTEEMSDTDKGEMSDTDKGEMEY
tara:strand:+ start:81 stop:326 length:246 start_codon:yes stop_codon:yes gene_type:complete